MIPNNLGSLFNCKNSLIIMLIIIFIYLNLFQTPKGFFYAILFFLFINVAKVKKNTENIIR